jgi:AcrR family transcriptional regulator
MREIAEAADMSMGQMYHYISSKDDVLFLIHKHMQTTWYQHLVNARIDEISDPLKKMESAIHVTIGFLNENKDLIQFIYSESKYLSKKHLQVVLEMDDKNVVEYWRNILEEVARTRGVEIDVDAAANLISYMLVFFSLRGWNMKSRPVKEIEEFITHFIFRGLGLTS